jgi:hypothetical protein
LEVVALILVNIDDVLCRGVLPEKKKNYPLVDSSVAHAMFAVSFHSDSTNKFPGLPFCCFSFFVSYNLYSFARADVDEMIWRIQEMMTNRAIQFLDWISSKVVT